MFVDERTQDVAENTTQLSAPATRECDSVNYWPRRRDYPPMKLAAWLLFATTLAALPAFAQVDFSGEWAPRFYEDQPERVPGPELGDYLGIPINAADRMRGDTWSASMMTLPEWQCRPHSADYIWRGPSNLRIWKEVDPVSREITAFHAEWLRSIDRPVYLDGREHPNRHANTVRIQSRIHIDGAERRRDAAVETKRLADSPRHLRLDRNHSRQNLALHPHRRRLSAAGNSAGVLRAKLG